MNRAPLRWLAVGMIAASSMLNYLDRYLLAAAAPAIKQEFHLNNTEYGYLGTAFSLVYALTAPLAGLFIDAVGLNVGVTMAIALWSLAAAATAWASTYSALVFLRRLLGVAEAAGIPNSGKAFATYLEPKELALGTASNSVGVSLGGVLAPLIMAAIAPRWGWRAAFVFCGALGLLWVPLWWVTAKAAPARPLEKTTPPPVPSMLRDPRFWGVVLTNVFIMMLFTLWTNWTTIYFVQERHLAQDDANRLFAWIPPVFGGLGGFAGGWIMLRWIRSGLAPVRSRVRLAGIAAVLLLVTATVPLMPSAALAAAIISLSFFCTMALSVAVYALPIDLFGAGRAGFSIAALTCAYGLMQAAMSPLIGKMVDSAGFNLVCIAFSFAPLIGYAILRLTVSSK
jgi:ACS family hexuronate transporter-like MFS transporter